MTKMTELLQKTALLQTVRIVRRYWKVDGEGMTHTNPLLWHSVVIIFTRNKTIMIIVIIITVIIIIIIIIIMTHWALGYDRFVGH